MIYNELWQLDQNNNGCTVSKRKENGEWENSDAEILLDEQIQASGKTGTDYAAKPLFAKIDPEILERSTFKALIRLQNNYIVHYRLEDTTTPEEQVEINNFFDVCLDTEVFQRAWQYINQIIGRDLSREEILVHLNRIWFTFFTNYYKGSSTHYCSGFEHVFVGEGKYSLNYVGAEGKGEVSGYHNWVKFYLDENIRKVIDYRGHWYKLHGNDGVNNVNVCTLQMVWSHLDLEGNVRNRMFKKMGGFFVGSSPELELAFGTVAYFENEIGVFSGDKRLANINDYSYNLVLYRNVLKGGGHGKHIRSFFPSYLGRDSLGDNQNMGSTISVSISEAFKNNGVVRISKALPNPQGPDTDGEWVELVNASDDTIDLTGWYLRDKVNRQHVLSGIIEPDQTLRIVFHREGMYSMQLGNSGGSIEVINSQGIIESGVVYQRKDVYSGQIIAFATGGRG